MLGATVGTVRLGTCLHLAPAWKIGSAVSSWVRSMFVLAVGGLVSGSLQVTVNDPGAWRLYGTTMLTAWPSGSLVGNVR
jgi:hypothetical protein